jgi:hypothetical protein
MSVRTNGRPGPATAAMSTQVDVMLRARATPLEPFGCSLTVTPAELPLLREGLVVSCRRTACWCESCPAVIRVTR